METSSQGEEERVEAHKSAVNTENALSSNAMVPNAMVPNAMVPNAMVPNAMVPNALTPSTLALSAMASFQDPGEAGILSRKFLKYAISCAFDPSQSFSLTWIDSLSLARQETYQGAVGLAPEWMTEPLSLTAQRWVSACIAARTNYYGVSVVISLRGQLPMLGTNDSERTTFSHMEGAFWGNLFAPMPTASSCYNGAERLYSRTKLRECAAGHDNVTFCGMMSSVGECAERCKAASLASAGFSACDDVSEVVTVFLD